MKKYLFLVLLFLFGALTNSQNNDSLPSLGDASSGSISLSGEYDLGRLWLSLFRSSAKEYTDPITKSYVKDFIYRISETSEVRDRRYEQTMEAISDLEKQLSRMDGIMSRMNGNGRH